MPVQGHVFDADGYPMVGATVLWDASAGTTTDPEGYFELPALPLGQRITITYIGFQPLELLADTLSPPLRLMMQEGTQLETVEVVVRDKGSYTSILDGRNIESMTVKELRKAPCCSLAESFENSPVVDLNYGDPLTGRREIQMLGLRGTYSQFTLEKRPALGGLASPYALDLIPGTWVSGIQVGKGAGSLETGAQGMSGQINAELQNPSTDAPLFINLFGNTQGRGEANLHANTALGEKWQAGAYLHSSFTNNKHDTDFDTFKDMPDRRTNIGMFRLFHLHPDDNWEGQWNIYLAQDQRKGGQLAAHDHGQSVLDPYLINQNNQRLEVFGKTGYFGFAKPHQSLGFIYSGAYHKLDNTYGRSQHLATQQNYYLNAMYHTQAGSERHKLALGGSFQHDDFDEALSDVRYDRTENVAGAYGEYTYNDQKYRLDGSFWGFTAIAGLRIDHHSLGGVQVSPRLNLKVNLSDESAIRLSAGRGWRSPSVLVENINRLPSSRQVLLDAPLSNDNPGYVGLETAWNFGANYTGHLHLAKKELQLVLDVYRTSFQNQLVVDVEENLEHLLIYQLQGQSFSNSALVSATYELFPRLDLKMAYKFNDVRMTYRSNGLRELPQTPRHRVLATLDYDGLRWRANVNYQWLGQQRLPDHGIIPTSVFVAQPQVAPAFGLLNAQVTYVVNSKMEIYAGAENITNVVQRNAIIGAYEPFDGAYFDASQVYQPLNRRMFFLGLRYALPK